MKIQYIKIIIVSLLAALGFTGCQSIKINQKSGGGRGTRSVSQGMTSKLVTEEKIERFKDYTAAFAAHPHNAVYKPCKGSPGMTTPCEPDDLGWMDAAAIKRFMETRPNVGSPYCGGVIAKYQEVRTVSVPIEAEESVEGGGGNNYANNNSIVGHSFEFSMPISISVESESRGMFVGGGSRQQRCDPRQRQIRRPPPQQRCDPRQRRPMPQQYRPQQSRPPQIRNNVYVRNSNTNGNYNQNGNGGISPSSPWASHRY